MIGNVHHVMFPARFARGDDVGKIAVIDLDIDLVGRAKGRDLHVIAVSTTLGHLDKMGLEHALNLLGRRHGRYMEVLSRIGASILALRVASRATVGRHVDKLLVIIGVFAHVLDHSCSDLLVLALITVKLIRQGIKQAIAYWDVRSQPSVRILKGWLENCSI